MKTINKTQFRLIYKMYNENEYHLTINNALQLEQAAKLSETIPDVFKFSHTGFKSGLLSASSFEDLMRLIKYNQKYEAEL